MAVVAAKPFLTQATFDVGTDTYTTSVNRAEFVPTAPEASIVDISGATVAFVGASIYVLNLTLMQDWTTTGLAKMFNTAEGTTVTVKLKFSGTGQGVWTAQVVLKAPSIGGDTNAVATSQVSLPVIGKPTWAAA